MAEDDCRRRVSALLRRIRVTIGVFVAGLVVSGATAIPLEWETGLLCRAFTGPPRLVYWLQSVHAGLRDGYHHWPFLAYGTDWLAFGHFMIAVAFIGAWRDPVRNAWVINFGILACILVVPYAWLMGALRDIPPGWRFLDCSFGMVGLLPLVDARRWTAELEKLLGGRANTG